ncbi:hypothetical protein EJ03DRAFT_82556 [Teratosphaeria nubilosa]|uniref:Extracellular membrane protein CFEM domain-containing protein n=1 Tax=Teratosphaeria nubilosa TaxID=161662 RepID=A0A6G1LAT9_9PEZI|nr:hypothetical protein EJ03DRAFT_82556 [Teratosphaeria nubilosa]
MHLPLLFTVTVWLLAPSAHGQDLDDTLDARGVGCQDDIVKFCQCVDVASRFATPIYNKERTRAACKAYPVREGTPQFTFDEHIDLCWDKIGVKGKHRPFCGDVFANRCGVEIEDRTFGSCADKPNDPQFVH